MTDHTDLLEQSFELNLNNYGPEDVERLNDWAIKAYAALETAQAEVKHLNLHLKATQSGRDAALARLAEIERQEPAYLLTPDGKCYAYGSAQPLSAGHADATLLELYAAAGASPVEPKGLFIDMIAEHPGLAEELRCLDIQPTKSDQHEQQLRPEVHSVGGQQPVEGAGVSAGAGFSGSRTDLVGSITALLSLDAAGALVPHGIGGHARTLLTAAAKALEEQPSQAQPPAPSDTAITYMTGYSDGREWAQTSQAVVVEPVYQYQLANGNWIDQTKESYDYNVKHGQATVRMLYATPQAAAQPEPSDLRGIDAAPVAEWVDLVKRGYVSRDECLIAVKDIPLWIAKNSQQAKPERAPLTVDVFYLYGHDPFICAVYGKISLGALSEIESDIQENPDFQKGDGVYSYSVTRFEGQYGFEGRCELSPGWELVEHEFTPIDEAIKQGGQHD